MLANKLHGAEIKYKPISFAEQGKNIKLALLASEDQMFAEHWGFDFNAIQGAIEHNAKGKKIRGGSTISQQTAKNIFLWQGRDWFRKGLEALFTLEIEVLWSKDRILEHYINIAEMGKGVYGVQSAAQHYFHCDANKLSETQAAWIAASLPSPKKMNFFNQNSTIKMRQARILKQMQNLKTNPNIIKLLQ